MEARSDAEAVAQLVRGLRSDIALVLRTLDDINDKFSLLQVILPKTKCASASASGAGGVDEDGDDMNQESQEQEHKKEQRKPTPDDIDLVNVEQEQQAPKQQQATVKRRLLWLVNKLFPTQQRFDPADPFAQQVLRDMGFSDEARNAQALRDNGGVMPRVLDALLAAEPEE